jgi:diguanylate cyclase (GGDEF)-like protein/PAS domain S-box-containing protein
MLESSAEHVPPGWWRRLVVGGSWLPRGGALSDATWQVRHRGITALVWLSVLALPLLDRLAGSVSTASVLGGSGVVALLAAGACVPGLGRTPRSAMATLGLVTSAALLVYTFDGLTEMHFAYFVIVPVVALYQAWWPYLLAVGFVLLQHGVVGTIAPQYVFDAGMRSGNPWTMAAVHGGFILAEAIACVLFWSASEEALDRERRALADVAEAHRDLGRAQQLASVGSWKLDLATSRLTWSDQLFALAGRNPADVVTVAWALDSVHPEDRARVADLLACTTSAGGRLDAEYRLVRPDGEVRFVQAHSEDQLDARGRLTTRIGTLHDVTESKRLQVEVEHLAFHDALTGLANRRLFLQRLDGAIARRRTPTSTCAVLYLDLDEFKPVNDTFGHSVGDALLRVTAEPLTAAVRSSDLVGRLGGDEFAILLEQVDAGSTQRLAEGIRTAVREPMWLEGTELSIRASIGFAVADDRSTATELLRNADAAMYAVKTARSTSPRPFPADPDRQGSG